MAEKQFKSLDDILQEYFGCKGSAFLKHPREIYDGTVEYFTKSGAKAYSRLEELLQDLSNLGVFEDLYTDAEEIIEVLDEIVRQD